VEAPEKYTSIIDSSFHVEYMKAELLSTNSPLQTGSVDPTSLLQLVEEIQETCNNFTSLISLVEKEFGNYIMTLVYNVLIKINTSNLFIEQEAIDIVSLPKTNMVYSSATVNSLKFVGMKFINEVDHHLILSILV
jgi:citrate lyase gamma subunit